MQVCMPLVCAGRSGCGASSSLLCMNRRLRGSKSVAAASLFPRKRRRRESRVEGGGDQERDGREQLRGERLRSPEVHGPFSREEQFGRCIEMDSAKRRRDVFFNDEADAVPRSKIIPVQIKPG